MLHCVRKQILELTVPKNDQVGDLHERVQRLYFSRLVPMMDQIFSDLAPNEAVVLIDRLELDLGDVSMVHLEEQIIDGTRAQLEQVLRKDIQSLREGDVNTRHPKILRVGDSKLQLIKTFLETGNVPWWGEKLSTPDLDTLFIDLIETSPLEVVVMIRDVASPTMTRRIVKQFSSTVHRKLEALLTPSHVEAINKIITDWSTLLSQATKGGASSGLSSSVIQEHILNYLIQEGSWNFSGEKMLTSLVTTAAMCRGDQPNMFMTHLAQIAKGVLMKSSTVRIWLEEAEQAEPSPYTKGKALPKGSKEIPIADLGDSVDPKGNMAVPYSDSVNIPLGREVAEDKPSKEDSRVKSDRGAFKSNERSFDEEGTHKDRSLMLKEARADPTVGQHTEVTTKAHDLSKRAEPLPDITREEEQYIENAGLVLVWPYLPLFFGTMGLVENKSFRSESAKERAVLLLQHLVTGESEWPEHELLLNKILCGWPLFDPVARWIDLTEQEQHESFELLQSVIGHWSALKGTSVPGFQQSFLQREGRLKEQDHGWHLMIPRTGFDVLLDRLPWGIGIVRLPWMATPLTVEW